MASAIRPMLKKTASAGGLSLRADGELAKREKKKKTQWLRLRPALEPKPCSPQIGDAITLCQHCAKNLTSSRQKRFATFWAAKQEKFYEMQRVIQSTASLLQLTIIA